jgi:CHC2 zinc finger/Reverse transcriptase (RNA-dependent DNA polymerase)
MGKLFELSRTFSSEVPVFNWRTLYPNGKKRRIAVPNVEMRSLHKRLIALLKKTLEDDLFLSHISSHGALSGGSIIENIRPHLYRRYFYQLDIKNAFMGVSLTRLSETLANLDSQLGSAVEIQEFLNRYCAGEHGGLAVGAPASPALFDLYCVKNIDDDISAIGAEDLAYSRYLDDITVSSNSPIPGILRKRIREVVTRAGFEVSHQKSHVTDRSRSPVRITGVILLQNNKITVPKDFSEQVSMILAKSISQISKKEMQKLAGHHGFLSMVGTLRSSLLTKEAQALLNGCKATLAQTSQRMRMSLSATSIPWRFSKRYLDEVRSAVSIVEVIEKYVKLKKVGNEFIGLCPFHNEKSPSFTVSPTKDFYHCFGCGAHGDVFSVMTDIARLSFLEGVRKIVIDHVMST